MKSRKILIMSVIIIVLFSLIIQSPKISDFAKKDDVIDKSIAPSNTQEQKAEKYGHIKHSKYDDVKIVDEKVYKIIKDIYDKIDFYGEFETGNLEVYDYYKKQYLKILKLERTFTANLKAYEYYNEQYFKTFINRRIVKKVYLNELGEIKWNWDLHYRNLNNFKFYFFDMDGDGVPELGIHDVRFIYFIKYDVNSDEFILWYKTEATSLQLLGSKKLWKHSASFGPIYYFVKLNQDGEEEYWLNFYIEPYYSAKKKKEKFMYMLALPNFTDKNKNIELTETMKKQAFLKGGKYYFRVTEEQWKELTKDFFEARKLTEKNIEKASFTYDELFGAFLYK